MPMRPRACCARCPASPSGRSPASRWASQRASHPRGGELAAFRPDVRLAPDHRDPGLRGRSAAALLPRMAAALGSEPHMSWQIFRTKYEIILRPLVVIIIALAAWELAARS